MTFLRFIQVAARSSTSFLSIIEYRSTARIYSIFIYLLLALLSRFGSRK